MKKTIVLGMSVLLFWSCNSSENATSSEEAAAHAETHTENHDSAGSGAVELNDGEKWVVNEEMKPFVQNGEELVDSYIQEGHSDYKALAAQLKVENTELIKSCTMTGKSHEELHKWLEPHLTMVKNLEDETDAAKANERVSQLQQSYQEYHRYFN